MLLFSLSDPTEKFSIVFAFSITMWVHINAGDEGLRQFLVKCCSLAEHLVIEPQPWKSYKSLHKRWKKLGQTPPPCYFSNNIRSTVEQDIQAVIDSCSFELKEVMQLILDRCTLCFVLVPLLIRYLEFKVIGETKWGRKICWFSRKQVL